MPDTELRYKLISIFLQAAEPLGLADLAAQCGAAEKRVRAALSGLLSENLVVRLGSMSRLRWWIKFVDYK